MTSIKPHFQEHLLNCSKTTHFTEDHGYSVSMQGSRIPIQAGAYYSDRCLPNWSHLDQRKLIVALLGCSSVSHLLLDDLFSIRIIRILFCYCTMNLSHSLTVCRSSITVQLLFSVLGFCPITSTSLVFNQSSLLNIKRQYSLLLFCPSGLCFLLSRQSNCVL